MTFIEKLRRKHENPIESAPVTLAFLGDSVTQGCFEVYQNGQQSLETEFRVADGYHTKLRHLLELCYPAAPVNMIHAGISGDNVVSGLARVDRDVIPFHPDLTIVSFGLNDCCRGLEQLEVYKTSLKQVLKKILDAGSEVIFMTPNAMADKVSFEVTNQVMKEAYAQMVPYAADLPVYMDGARAVCHELGVPVCDCFRKWEMLKNNGVDVIRLLSNRINHPIEELHWMFAVSLFEMMMKEDV